MLFHICEVTFSPTYDICIEMDYSHMRRSGDNTEGCKGQFKLLFSQVSMNTKHIYSKLPLCTGVDSSVIVIYS